MGKAAGQIMRHLLTKEGDAPDFHQATHPLLVENRSVRTM